jgi:hypothetical protein
MGGVVEVILGVTEDMGGIVQDIQLMEDIQHIDIQHIVEGI